MTEASSNQFHAQAIIEELRYWVPAVKDVAEILEFDEPEGWRLFVIPNVQGACPAEVLLRTDGLFDLEIAGETYGGLTLTSRDLLIRMLDGVALGRVCQRDWRMRATGASLHRETVIYIDEDAPWILGVSETFADRLGDMFHIERHFLPYRR